MSRSGSSWNAVAAGFTIINGARQCYYKCIRYDQYRVRNSIKTLEKNELIRKSGNGPSTKYAIGIESVEFLTQMQMVMDILKRQVI